MSSLVETTSNTSTIVDPAGDKGFTCLEGKSIIVRRMIEEDIPAFHKYRADPNVAKYQGWENFTLADAVKFVNEQKGMNPNMPDNWIQLTIAMKDSNESVGDVAFGYRTSEENPGGVMVHMGITMAPEHQRKGIAFEAASALLRYLFLDLQKNRVVATVDSRNTASLTLFRKLKFREEGFFVENSFFKGEWSSEVQFAMLKSEYLALYSQ